MYVIVQKDTRIKLGTNGKPDIYGIAKKFSTKRRALDFLNSFYPETKNQFELKRI